MKLEYPFVLPRQELIESDATYKLRVIATFEAHLQQIQNSETSRAGKTKLMADGSVLFMKECPEVTWDDWKARQRAEFLKFINA